MLARKHIGASLLPIVIVVVTWRGGTAVPLLAGLALLGALGIVLEWRAFRYRVADGRLVVERGVVRRSRRVIPLDRIRSVDITATWLHRVLGVVGVRVDAATGGQRGGELVLAAVSHRAAHELRDSLLSARTAPDEEAEETPAAATLYRASPGMLALAGATSARFVLAPLAVIGVVWNLAEDLPGSFPESLGETALEHSPSGGIWLAVLGLVGICAVIGLGALGSLIVDWDFMLTDDGERLVAGRGLLTRRSVTLDRARLRGVDVRDTPLRRPFGLASVSAVASGVGSRAGGRAMLSPIVERDGVGRLLRALDPAVPDPGLPLSTHPRAARRRRVVRAVPAPAVLAVLAGLLGAWWAAGAFLAVAAAGVPLALDRYRQLGHRYDGKRVTARGGSLIRRWSAFDPAAVVAYDVRRSPGQARAGLCTLRLHLGQGVGSRRILDCSEAQARTLLVALDRPLFETIARRAGSRP